MNLLIVDDEIVTTQVLEEQLDRALLSIDQIYVAYNTSMARDILQKNKVELILCDIEMPKENGIHFLKWVREQKIQTEVIFLTSHEKFEYAYGSVQNGAANYLLKPIDMNKINQTLLRVTEKIVWKQKTEEIREYWESGIRKMVRYFWTRVLLEPGVQKQGLEEEIKQQGIEEEIQEKYCVVILHFASGKLDLGKEKGQESIYKFAMENILAEAFTEKIKMENVICWEENKGTYLGILSEFSEKETKERAEQVRNIFEKYFPETLQIGYISPSVPFYEVGLEKEKIMEYDKTHIYDEGEIKEFMVLLREKEASGHILDEDYILQCLKKGSRVSTLEYLQKMLQHVKQTMHSVEGFRNFQVELTQLVSKYLHDKNENMNSVIHDPIYLKLDMNAVKSEFSMVQWMTWLMNKVFDLTQKEQKEKTEKRITDQVIDYIREHYTEDINRNTLSERFHFSPEYIGKMFRKDIGTSLNDYINSLRVEKAKHLLENTNTKVIDIALEVGFDTLPYFSSVFKKYTGLSPAEFRKRE